MKAGKTKKRTIDPLPTDNPNPNRTSSVLNATAWPATEPAPQPVATVKRTMTSGALRVSTEPTPQPVFTKSRRKAATTTSSQSPKLPTPEVQPSPIAIDEATAPESATAMAPLATAAAPAVTRPSIPGPTPSKARPVRQPRPVPVEIPAILLEPDHVVTEPVITGPGARFALTPEKHAAPAAQPDELPEAYGTQQIFLAARDPYWLFASWDLDAKQRARYNSASASGALTIRLRRGFVEGPIHLEVHTLPTARDWFIEVGAPDTSFVAELGYHEKNSGNWQSISVSKPVTTPRDRPHTFQTRIPEAAPTAVEMEAAQTQPSPYIESQPQPEPAIIFAEQPALEPPRWMPHFVQKQEPEQPQLPRWSPPSEQPRWSPAPKKKQAPKKISPPRWTAAQAKALDELISLEFRRMQMGSLEIEEVLKRRVLQSQEQAPSSLDLLEWEELSPEERVAEALGLAKAQAPSSLELAESPERPRRFWFKVNAELIIYGSTEPDAHVAIGGRPIRLRPDGTFSYRFALPDGAYELPVIALSHDGSDGRAAELRFSRATFYSGDVGQHPQDAALKSPSPANI